MLELIRMMLADFCSFIGGIIIIAIFGEIIIRVIVEIGSIIKAKK